MSRLHNSQMSYICFKSPFAWTGIAKSDRGIARLNFGAPTKGTAIERLFDSGEAHKNAQLDNIDPDLSAAADLLKRYFNGQAVDFSSLSIDLAGRTPFQQAVWQIACQIPYGKVKSYGWIALQIGKPKAPRAVGGAMGSNPLPILIPCHRVVRSDGGLGGYSGGLEWKQRLLALERV